MPKVYILNTLVVPVDFEKYPTVTVRLTSISLDEAREIVKGGFESAVGHESTAVLLSRLLGVEVPCDRKAVYLEPGDVGIHFCLKTRLPEGVVLNEKELQKLDFWLVKSELLPVQKS